MPASHYGCAPAPGDAVVLCGFVCPICSREIFAPLSGAAAGTLLALGAQALTGAVPFELLESHEGPPVSWNEVLDLRNELASTCCPQDELIAQLGERASVTQTTQARRG